MSDPKPQYNYEGPNIVIVPTDQPPNKKKKIDIKNIESTVTSSEVNTFVESVPCCYTGHNTTGVDWSTNQRFHQAVNALHWDYNTFTKNNDCVWNQPLVEYCYPQPEAYYYGHQWERIPVISQDNLNEGRVIESQIENSLLYKPDLNERDKNYEKEINTFLNKIKIPNTFHGKKCDTVKTTKNKDNTRQPKPKALVVNQDDIKHKSKLINVKSKSKTPDIHNEKDNSKISSENNINEPIVNKISLEKTEPIIQKNALENTINKYSSEKAIKKYSPVKSTAHKIKKYSPEKSIKKYSPEKTIKKHSPEKTINKLSPEKTIANYSPEKGTEPKIKTNPPEKIQRLQKQLQLIKEEINKRKKKILKKLIITEHQELKSKNNNKKKLELNKKEDKKDKIKKNIKKLPSVESKHQNKEKVLENKTKRKLTVYKSSKLECDNMNNYNKRINNNADVGDNKPRTHLKSVVKVVKDIQQKRTTRSQNINSRGKICKKVIRKTVNINTKNREIRKKSSILSERYKNATETSTLKKHDDICVSIKTNERNESTNNCEINRQVVVQHKNLGRVIDITINFIPETMAKNENNSSLQKSEEAFIDTSFLDDINVDEIVECLKIQESIPVNKANEKNAFTNEVQLQEDSKKKTKPDVNLNECNVQLNQKTKPRMVTDDFQSDFNKVFSLDYILGEKQEYDELGEIIKNIQETNTSKKHLTFAAKEIVLENGDKTVRSCSREHELIQKLNEEGESEYKSKCNSELFNSDCKISTGNEENKTVVMKADHISIHTDNTIITDIVTNTGESSSKKCASTFLTPEIKPIQRINEDLVKKGRCCENGIIESKDDHLVIKKHKFPNTASEIKACEGAIEDIQDKILDTISVCKKRKEIIEIDDTETERNKSSIVVIDITSSPQNLDEDIDIIEVEERKNVNTTNEENSVVMNHAISIAKTSRKTTDTNSINYKPTIHSQQLNFRSSVDAKEQINNDDETAMRITALLTSVMESVKNTSSFTTNTLPKSSTINVSENESPHPGKAIISEKKSKPMYKTPKKEKKVENYKSHRMSKNRNRKNNKPEVRDVPLSTPEKNSDRISQGEKEIRLLPPVSVNTKKINPIKPIMVVQPQLKKINDGNSDVNNLNNVSTKSEINDGKKPETSELKEMAAVKVNIDNRKPIDFIPREIITQSTPKITPPTSECYIDTKNLQQRLSSLFRTSYGICGIIHNGKYGRIYQCKSNSGDVVAAKFMHLRITFNNNEKMLKDVQEGVPLEKLNCVHLMNSLIIHSRWCYVFDYYPKNLDEALKESPSGFHVSVLQHLARQLISAVLILRNRDIVHSDIKPHHILMSTTNDKLKLCGFDEAYHLSRMQLGCSTGTAQYRAPEIILGHSAGHSVDVWSTAVVLHEMATNMKLFPGNTNNEVLYEQQSTLGPVPTDMLNRCLFKDAHYVDNKFLRRCLDVVDGVVKPEISLLEKFTKSARLSTSIFNAYFKNYGIMRNKEEKADDLVMLRKFEKLIVQMLNMDPRNRIAIEFVYANPFIYE